MKKIKRFLVLCLVCAMFAGIMVIPANAVVFTRADAEALVTQFYAGLLDRAPDDAGLACHVDRLFGGTSVGQLAVDFLGSAEFGKRQLTNEAYVRTLYKGLLGREADQGGLDTFLSQMDCGQSRTWVYLQFLGSPEFEQLCRNKYKMDVGSYPNGKDAPSPNPTEVNVAEARKFVEGLYENLLNRGSDEAGMQHWLNMLSLKKMSAAGVAVSVASSAEFNAISYTNSEFINRCYLALLGRKYDVGGYTNFVNHLNSGKSRAWVFAAICDSAEFQRRAAFAPGGANVTPGVVTPGQSGNVGGNAVNAEMATEYVKRLYANILNRSATEKELSEWVEKLVNRQMSAAGVAASIAASPEAKTNGVYPSADVFLDRIYQALLGRSPDTIGKGNFLKYLSQGYSRSWVFSKICASEEFQNSNYYRDMNVVPGTINAGSYNMDV